VKVGDVVLFTSYAGEEFKKSGDKKVLLMREDDILAVLG
jgi:chaperonin GroES